MYIHIAATRAVRLRKKASGAIGLMHRLICCVQNRARNGCRRFMDLWTYYHLYGFSVVVMRQIHPHAFSRVI